MDTKLTLKLDQDVIEKTKKYAERRGISLSAMVESYFIGLTRAGGSRLEPTGVVAELAGLLRGVKVDRPEESYADHLAEKYS